MWVKSSQIRDKSPNMVTLLLLQVAMKHADGCDVMMNRVMPKDNIALAILLETKEAAWDTQPSQPDQVRGHSLMTSRDPEEELLDNRAQRR